MPSQVAIWMVFTVLRCIVYASVQAVNLTNVTQKHIPVDVFCKNNTEILCAMMYKSGCCCSSFRVGEFTIALSDTGSGNASSRFHNEGIGSDTNKTIGVQDQGDTTYTLQSTETSTTQTTNHVFVFCNDSVGLYQASEHGPLAKVRFIIQHGLEDINCQGKKKRSPVMAAVKMGQGEVFDFLVSQGCQLFGVDYLNNNILHLACRGGNTGIVRKLVADEAFDVESRGYHGETPIMLAAYFGNREVFDFLMNRGSNMEIVDYDNNTILHVACFSDHVEMVKYILSLNIPGIDVESRGFNGETPIMVAAENGKREVFDFLMNRGSNMEKLDYHNNTILHHVACFRDHVEMVEYILSLNIPGIDVENRGHNGRTSIMLAAEFGNREVFDFLMSRGSNMKILDYDNDTILHVACLGNVEMVKYILSLNIPDLDVESRGYNGKTVVLTSAQYGETEMFNWLVSKGCDLSAMDDEGNNILHSACIGGNIDLVKYIITLGKGYETLENKSGYTPVQLAESYGYGLIVALLLRNG